MKKLEKSKKIKKIGIYGGSFDPIHFGHINLAIEVLENSDLDEILFCPAYISPHKKEKPSVADPEKRLEMTKIALEDINFFSVCNEEIKRGGISYTIDTISSFRQYEKIGTTDLYLIIGIDNLSEFHRWKDPDKVLDQVKVVVIRRSGYNDRSLLEKYRNKVTFLESPLIDISATEIREKVLNNQDISDLVPPAVQKIILKEGLYK